MAIEAALQVENRLRCEPPLSDSEVLSVARSITRYPPGEAEILSASSIEEVKAERILHFRNGAEIAKETPKKVPWVIRPWIAYGAVTEVAGKPKASGKTTLLTYMVRAALDGDSFLGEKTQRTKAIYLSEQAPTTFRAALERAGLLWRRDFSALFWPETFGLSWEVIARAAVEKCKKDGAKLLVIDTLPQFARLAGDAENASGDALKVLAPLQEAAAAGIAVVVIRHERKSGGQLGDSGRGSSAFAGAADIVVSLREPEGKHPRNVRLIKAFSRFDNPEDMLIELTAEGYRSLGAPGDAAKAQAAAELLAVMPKSKKKAATIEELVKTAEKSRAKVQHLLDDLVEADEVQRCGKGCRGNPYRYFRL